MGRIRWACSQPCNRGAVEYIGDQGIFNLHSQCKVSYLPVLHKRCKTEQIHNNKVIKKANRVALLGQTTCHRVAVEQCQIGRIKVASYGWNVAVDINKCRKCG